MISAVVSGSLRPLTILSGRASTRLDRDCAVVAVSRIAAVLFDRRHPHAGGQVTVNLAVAVGRWM
jgi:hypothetical protein